MKIEQIIERLQNMRNSTTAPYIKQRVARTAQELDRSADVLGRVEALNESLFALVALLYSIDDQGQAANIDAKTWRLLVPAPWGSAGWKRWGLRRWEATVMRKILLQRCHTDAPLFDYNNVQRYWCLNRYTYPTIDHAFDYLRRQSITIDEWNKYALCQLL